MKAKIIIGYNLIALLDSRFWKGQKSKNMKWLREIKQNVSRWVEFHFCKKNFCHSTFSNDKTESYCSLFFMFVK